jgi:hypothetical protein
MAQFDWLQSELKTAPLTQVAMPIQLKVNHAAMYAPVKASTAGMAA